MIYTPDRELNPPDRCERCVICSEIIDTRFPYTVEIDEVEELVCSDKCLTLTNNTEDK